MCRLTPGKAPHNDRISVSGHPLPLTSETQSRVSEEGGTDGDQWCTAAGGAISFRAIPAIANTARQCCKQEASPNTSILVPTDPMLPISPIFPPGRQRPVVSQVYWGLWALELGSCVQILALLLISWMTLGKVWYLSIPQFSCWQNGAINCSYIIEMSWWSNEVMQVPHKRPGVQ